MNDIELSSAASAVCDGYNEAYTSDSPVIEQETQKESKARHKLEKKYNEREINLTEEQQEFIDTKLSSKLWRLDNLYTIRDKDAVKQIMRLNPSQRKILVKFKHNKKIILKSRQQGISTLYLAYYLDSCLFSPGFQAGIQSYGQDEADKLAKRALLMWDELDSNIKELLDIRLISNNQKGMSFSNGSILKIGNFRGDTLQGLHVSELGKIAKKYPEKAKELKTGAFQAVGKNSRITIESTAEGKTGLFYEMWQKSKIKEGNGTLGPFDFQPIFLSWLEDPDAQIDHPYDTQEFEDYFTKLEKQLDIAITSEQKWWYVSKADELGEDMKQEYPSYPEEAFEQSVEGTYYKEQYKRLVEEGRVLPKLYNPSLPVFAIFDLGMNDQMCINFTQLDKGTPKIIREYDNNGENIEYYVNIMRSMPFKVKRVYLPHDANVKELGTGRTRLEEFRRLGVTCTLLKRQSIQDGINAARLYIDSMEIDESCEGTIEAIQNYRQKFDKRLGVFMGVPEHDEFSHYADVIRYSALGLTYHKVRRSKPKTMEQKFKDYKTNNSNGFAV